MFAFMFWWSYLLYTKIEQHYSDIVDYKSLQFEVYSGGNRLDYFSTTEFANMESKFNREKIMIVAEGMVFFIILTIGMMKVYHSFKQEIAIAKQQKNFLLSITHELKSPLASIKLINETIKMRELNREKEIELLDSSLSEVDRLENLVENILIAAKIENDKYGFNKESICLSTICKQVYNTYANRKDIILHEAIQEDVYIDGDKTCFNSILSNLLDNAIKYAKDSEVLISLKQENKTITLKVADKGNGISGEEKEKIFDKFYRTGNEETRAAKGTGLGLYIVKQLVSYHEGKIVIEDNQPKGSVFKMTFTV